jgi:predicted DCC family thiol-disulfide oxidoreductase YuxK
MDTAAGPIETGHGVHLVLYDGVCGLCQGVCQFIVARDPDGVFDFASLQSGTGRAWLERFGRDPHDLDSFCLITDYRTRPVLQIKSRAALAVAAELGSPWRWLTVGRALPRRIGDWVYDIIARYRYQWFGRTDSCLMPSPDVRQRFLDL